MRREEITLTKGPAFDERIATFADGYQIVISQGWSRNGGAGWLVAGVTTHTSKSMRQAAIDGRKARERKRYRRQVTLTASLDGRL